MALGKRPMTTDEEFEAQFARDWDRCRGMLLGLIESFGLEHRHERAMASTLKSFTYDRQKEQLERIQSFLAE
jgi:hypothetical protein